MAADVNDLWPPFRARVRSLLADPDARDLGLYVVSAFRSRELQASLYADAVRRYGVAEAGKWVAPPGKSNHGPMLDDHGHKPGQWGQAVDLGIPGTPAVKGRWPVDVRNNIQDIAARHKMHQAMPWEDWHYEPDKSLLLHPDVEARAAAAPQEKEEVMAMVVVDPKTPADGEGRLPNWEANEDGDLFAWNGARPLKPLSAFAKTHPKIVAIALEPGGDGVVLFGNDTHQEPNGAWVRSTYKITVGLPRRPPRGRGAPK